MAEASASETGRIGFEAKESKRLYNFIKGPYSMHSFLVHNVQRLKRENGVSSPHMFSIFPLTNICSHVGQTLAVVGWFLLLLYPFICIPTACVCRNSVNVINAVVLSLLLVWHMTATYIITENGKKFKTLQYVAKVPVEKYMGTQNCHVEIAVADLDSFHFVTEKQRNILKCQKRCCPESSFNFMLYTNTYWRNRVTDPLMCLVILVIFYLVSLILQLVFFNMSTLPMHHS